MRRFDNLRLCKFLFWCVRTVVAGSASLAAYIVYFPAVTYPYGPAAGLFSIGLATISIWFSARTAIFLLGGD